MNVLSKKQMILGGVMIAVCAVFGIQAEIITLNIPDDQAEQTQDQSDKKLDLFDYEIEEEHLRHAENIKRIENNRRLRYVRLENVKKFRASGECAGCDLRGMDLVKPMEELNGKNMSIDLTAADLTNVFGLGANFKKANLTRAIIDGACFHNADFTGANLTGVSLQNTDFTGANLDYARLHDVSCEFPGGPRLRDVKNLDTARFSDEFTRFRFRASAYAQNNNPFSK